MTALTSLYNKNHLSKRPFLVVNTAFKPPQGANTSTKGWAEKTGWDRHEYIVIVDRVKDKHVNTSAAIIDVLEVKCVKNTFDHTDQEVIQYFLVKYEKELKEALKVWANKESLKLATVANFNKDRQEQAVAEMAKIASDAATGDGESQGAEQKV